jgi:hypothetical protein
MTLPPDGTTTPRLRAAVIALGLDGPVRPLRIVHGTDSLLIGGSDSTRAEMLETLLRLEDELDRRQRRLGDLEPMELIEIAVRIDSPELEAIGLRMLEGLAETGRSFREASPEELTAMATSAVA